MSLGAVTGIVAVAFQEIVEFSLQMPGNAAFFTVLCAIAVRKASVKGARAGAGAQPVVSKRSLAPAPVLRQDRGDSNTHGQT